MSEGAHGPPPAWQMTFADIMQCSWWRIWGPRGLRQIAVDNQSVDRGWDELPRKTTVVASLNPTARIMFARRIRCGSTRLTPGSGRGLIGITFAPGKHDRHATGGPWAASRVDRCKAHRSRHRLGYCDTNDRYTAK